jgi:hypothetical protein
MFRNCLNFIEIELQKDLPKTTHTLLTQIKQLITASKHGDDADILKRALCFIESLPIMDGEKNDSTIWAYLYKLELRALCTRPNELLNKLGPPLSPEVYCVLITIHQELIGKIAWTYSYPCNEQGEVSNPTVRKFKSQIQQLPAKTSAFLDYKRDIQINGHNASTEEEMCCAIRNLVDNSNYPTSLRPLVYNWVKKSAQDNLRLVDLLIADSHFLNEPGWALARSERAYQGWEVEDGEICFKFSISIKCLQKGLNDILIHSARSNKVGIFKDAGLELEPYIGNDLPSLMHCKAKISLRPKGNNIEPCLRECSLTSYTNVLQSPARLFWLNASHWIGGLFSAHTMPTPAREARWTQARHFIY